MSETSAVSLPATTAPGAVALDAVTRCCTSSIEPLVGRVEGRDHDVEDGHPPDGPVPHPWRDHDGAARSDRHRLTVELHDGPGGTFQDVVHLGVVAVIMGAGIALDLDPMHAGRRPGH